jgi:hypothetical protein
MHITLIIVAASIVLRVGWRIVRSRQQRER